MKTITVWQIDKPIFTELRAKQGYPLVKRDGERDKVLPRQDTSFRLSGSEVFERARVFGVRSRV